MSMREEVRGGLCELPLPAICPRFQYLQAVLSGLCAHLEKARALLFVREGVEAGSPYHLLLLELGSSARLEDLQLRRAAPAGQALPARSAKAALHLRARCARRSSTAFVHEEQPARRGARALTPRRRSRSQRAREHPVRTRMHAHKPATSLSARKQIQPPLLLLSSGRFLASARPSRTDERDSTALDSSTSRRAAVCEA